MKKRSKDKVGRDAAPEIIPGAVVRDLVDRNEQRIEELEHELATAARRAEEAELRVAVLSGDEHPVHPNGSNSRAAGPPRTTVVARSRPQEAG